MRAPRSLVVLLASTCTALAGTPNAADIDKITLERTACFGSCPIYKVTLRRDGTVTYDGKMFVKVKGHRSRKIPRADFQQLASEVSKCDFFGFESEYVLKDKHPDGRVYVISDLPSAITTVQAGKLRKSVSSDDCASESAGGLGPDAVLVGRSPEALRRLEILIDKISRSSVWVGEGT